MILQEKMILKIILVKIIKIRKGRVKKTKK